MEAVDDFAEFRTHEEANLTIRMVEFEESGETVRRFFSDPHEAADYLKKLHFSNTPYLFKPMHCPSSAYGVATMLNNMDPYRSVFDTDVIPF